MSIRSILLMKSMSGPRRMASRMSQRKRILVQGIFLPLSWSHLMKKSKKFSKVLEKSKSALTILIKTDLLLF